MQQAIVLFAHGARDPEWAAPLQRVRAAMAAQAPQQAVELAFLEFMTPTLPDCVAGLAARGCARIVVLPMFIAQGGHLKRDLPQMVDELRGRYPQMEFVLAGPVGENDAVIEAMARAALALVP